MHSNLHESSVAAMRHHRISGCFLPGGFREMSNWATYFPERRTSQSLTLVKYVLVVMNNLKKSTPGYSSGSGWFPESW